MKIRYIIIHQDVFITCTNPGFHDPRISSTTSCTMNFGWQLFYSNAQRHVMVGALFSGSTRCMASTVDLLKHVTWDDTSLPSEKTNVTIKNLPFAKRNYSKNGSIFHCHVCLRECEIGKKGGSKCRDTMWKKNCHEHHPAIMGILSTHVFCKSDYFKKKHPCFVARSSLFFRNMLHLLYKSK